MLEFESNLDAEQCMYHHALSDIAAFVSLYGWDVVLQDIADYYHKQMLYKSNA